MLSIAVILILLIARFLNQLIYQDYLIETGWKGSSEDMLRDTGQQEVISQVIDVGVDELISNIDI